MSSVEESYRGKHVRVFRLRQDEVVCRLRECAQRLLQVESNVLEVRLFGSLGRGEAAPGSDADLWVLVHTANRPETAARDSVPTLQRAFADAGIGCDVLVYSVADWERLRKAGRRLTRVIDQEGVVLASRRRPK